LCENIRHHVYIAPQLKIKWLW